MAIVVDVRRRDDGSLEGGRADGRHTLAGPRLKNAPAAQRDDARVAIEHQGDIRVSVLVEIAVSSGRYER